MNRIIVNRQQTRKPKSKESYEKQMARLYRRQIQTRRIKSAIKGE